MTVTNSKFLIIFFNLSVSERSRKKGRKKKREREMKAFFIELVLRRLIQKVFSRILWGHMQWWQLHCMGWRFNVISNVYFCHRIMNLRVGPNKRKLLTFFTMDLVFFIYCYPTDIWAPLNPTCWRTCISLLLRMNPTLFREGALWETDQFSCLTSWYIEKKHF